MVDIERYKKALTQEKEKLEQELSRLGVETNPETGEWEQRSPDLDIMEADQNEAADRNEEANIDQIVFDELEARYRLVRHALKKIDAGTYGMCEKSGQEIEEDRLTANPAARTCKTHMGEEASMPL
jgi:RNA polymerase-binding transcription factor DksA